MILLTLGQARIVSELIIGIRLQLPLIFLGYLLIVNNYKIAADRQLGFHVLRGVEYLTSFYGQQIPEPFITNNLPYAVSGIDCIVRE